MTHDATAAEVRRNVEYGRAGGQSLQLDAFIPEGAGPFPAAIVVHGGSWVGGDRRRNVEPLFAPLLEGGFACLSISYRLANQLTIFGAAVEDVELAVRYVQFHAQEFRVDRERITLIGESAGGQLAAMAALGGAESAVKAAVAFYAPLDLEELARNAKMIPEPFRGMFGALRLGELSPIRRVHRGMPPFLLIHGTADAVVPFEQSRAMCREIRKTGGECDLLAVKGGGHGLRWWESAGLVSYKRMMVEWLRKRIPVQ